MPAMLKANERCYKRTFGFYGLEAVNHRSEFKILWDTFRSQIAELWFPYDRRIANDRRWSQTIAEDRTMFYLLRSSAITITGSQKCVSIWSQTIAELSAIRDRLRSHGNQPNNIRTNLEKRECMVFNRKRAKSKVHTHYNHDPRGVAITLFVF